MIPCILVGGKSTRMGRDKALIPVEGIPNAQRIADLARALCRSEPVFLGDERPALNGLFIADRQPGEGPLSAILAAFDRFPNQTLLVLACDLPRLNRAALMWLINQANTGDSVWPRFADSAYLEPLLGIYQPALLQALDKAYHAGARSLNVLAAHLTVNRPQIPEEHVLALRNANTPNEWN